jgi:hypothetical protein
MADKLTFKIESEATLRDVMMNVWQKVCQGIKAGPVIVELGREKRTLDQNAKMWPMLTDLSKQKEWAGEMRSPEDWKDVCTALFEKQKVVPGIDGGFVALGARTKKYDKKKFSEFIECLYWIGQEFEIKWSEKSLKAYEQWGEDAYSKGINK